MMPTRPPAIADGSLMSLCAALAVLLKPHAEVVLHDLKTGRIRYLANGFSKRRVGDASLIESLENIEAGGDVIGPYRKTNFDGRRLKSVTAVIRDPRGQPTSLLCINYDVEAFETLRDHLENLVALPELSEQSAALFSGDWRERVNEVVGVFLGERGITVTDLTPEDQVQLVRRLDEAGVFAVRKAVEYVQEVLRLSRATIYKRLSVARARNGTAGAKASKGGTDLPRQAK